MRDHMTDEQRMHSRALAEAAMQGRYFSDRFTRRFHVDGVWRSLGAW